MITAGIAGRFKLEAVNVETGERRELAPWFNNLITDSGLNAWGTGGILGGCAVGTGSTAPAVSDTALATWRAYSNTVTSNVLGGQATVPYYSSVTRVYRFAAGTATGNLTELGVCVGSSTTTLFSRTLIKDGSGNPTTITVLASEALDVTYELRLYAPSADVPHSTVIAGVTYTGVVRAANVTSFVSSGYTWSLGNSMVGAVDLMQSGYVARVGNGSIGAITSAPGGTNVDADHVAASAYSNGSLARSGTLTLGLSQGNVAGGITTALIPTKMGAYQISFSPAIPKDATKVLTLGLTLSWARMVI